MNNSELFDFLPFMIDDERAFIYTMPLSIRVSYLMTYIICGIWGSGMKFFLFFNLMQEKISERPINILIIIDQSIEYFGNIVVIVNTIIKVIYFLLLVSCRLF